MAKTKRRRKSEPDPGPVEPRAAPAPAPFGALRAPALCAALVVAVLLAYWGVLSCEFVNYDDTSYILENSAVRKGLNPHSAAWALTSTACANWHPVTWLSHMLDVQLFGLDAGMHHGTNLLLHAVNAVLFLLLLLNMTGALWRSSLAAFLFALHPLHVESVAWVAERKDLLSTLFWLLTLAAWLGSVRSRKAGWYTLSLLLFALGLMSKPMLVTLPFTLLLLDFWPLGRITFPAKPGALRPLLLEKWPLFVLSAASCVLTLLAQLGGGAVRSLEGVSVPGRLANAAWAYGSYLLKTILPSRMSVFYPYPRGGHPAWEIGLAALALLIATVWVLRLRRKAAYLAFGWLWYLGTLVPVIGLVQVGSQEMADRYTYIPLVGIFVALSWGLGSLAEKGRWSRFAISVACTLALLPLLALTRAQVAHWKDSASLFRHALAVTSENCVAHNNLGTALLDRGEDGEALGHFREAIRIEPSFANAHDNLGLVLEKMGRHSEAVEHFRLAVRYGSRSATTLANLGNEMVAEGRLADAVEEFRRAIAMKPEFADAHHNLGLALTALGRLSEATEEFRLTLQLKPDDPKAHHQLGRVLASQGQHGEAVRHYREAVRLKADFPEALNDLGVALAAAGRLTEAESSYSEAIRLRPDFADAHNNLGLALASQGRIPEAGAQFRQALTFRPDFADAHNNLGAALARENRIADARDEFREALRLRPDFADAQANLRQMEGALAGSKQP